MGKIAKVDKPQFVPLLCGAIHRDEQEMQLSAVYQKHPQWCWRLHGLRRRSAAPSPRVTAPMRVLLRRSCGLNGHAAASKRLPHRIGERERALRRFDVIRSG